MVSHVYHRLDNTFVYLAMIPMETSSSFFVHVLRMGAAFVGVVVAAVYSPPTLRYFFFFF
jgi:hypothetical protein